MATSDPIVKKTAIILNSEVAPVFLEIVYDLEMKYQKQLMNDLDPALIYRSQGRVQAMHEIMRLVRRAKGG